MKKYTRVLTIAGSDSGGGAGIQADIKTISACGCYATSSITAITAQNTLGVSDIHNIPVSMVRKQIIAILDDIGTDAVKLGMLPNEEIVRAVAELLTEYKVPNIVLDPVMVATSGNRLISDSAARAIIEQLFPIATLITPNIPEIEFLTGVKIYSEADFAQAAETMHALNAGGVLLKSGHLEGHSIADYLSTTYLGATADSAAHSSPTRIIRTYRYEKIDTPNTHGTGCTLSSAIASYLAMEEPIEEAVQLAENYIHKAIINGDEYRLGKGHGPVDHFFKYR